MTYRSYLSLPPLECLIAALTAARLGSLSGAALELGVSHAAISRRINGAESWAGIRLFDRHARGVSPTADGQRLLTRVSQGIDIIDASAERARIVRGSVTLRIATTPSFARLWLLPRLTKLESDCGGIRIEVIAHTGLTNLRDENIDIAIRYGRGGWKSGTEQCLFKDVTLTPFVRASMLPKRTSGISARTIAALPLIHNGDSTEWRAWFDAHQIRFRGKPSDRVLGDYGLALTAAEMGLGVAIGCRPLLTSSGIREPMRAIDALSVTSPLVYFIVTKPGIEEGPVHALIRCLLMESRNV